MTDLYMQALIRASGFYLGDYFTIEILDDEDEVLNFIELNTLELYEYLEPVTVLELIEELAYSFHELMLQAK